MLFYLFFFEVFISIEDIVIFLLKQSLLQFFINESLCLGNLLFRPGPLISLNIILNLQAHQRSLNLTQLAHNQFISLFPTHFRLPFQLNFLILINIFLQLFLNLLYLFSFTSLTILRHSRDISWGKVADLPK